MKEGQAMGVKGIQGRAFGWMRAPGSRLAIVAVLGFLCLSPLAALAEVRIVRPAQGETIHHNAGDVQVVVEGAPPGSHFRAVIDGTARGVPSDSPAFVVAGVDRGTHRLVVVVIDGRGEEVERTEPVEFYVWQASRLFQNRRGGS